MSVNIIMTEMNLVYEGNWSTYEEWGGVRIYEDSKEECFYISYGGYCVMLDSNDPEWDELEIIAASTVLEIIDEWDIIEKENEEYWG